MPASQKYQGLCSLILYVNSGHWPEMHSEPLPFAVATSLTIQCRAMENEALEVKGTKSQFHIPESHGDRGLLRPANRPR